MNKELYTKRYDGAQITGLIVKDEEVVIELGEQNIKLTSEHDQDCCENVYADFSIMKYHSDRVVGKHLDELIIKGVSDMGFLLCFAGEKIFIPCYNSQNGYYSDNLAVVITYGAEKTTVDLEGFIEDNID